MNILETIIGSKVKEVKERKESRNIIDLEKMPFFSRKTFSLQSFLMDDSKTSIIAEFKKKSPSKGIINSHSQVERVVKDYVDCGASAISVLTDELFFGGSLEDLQKARSVNIPLLRKDFIIDEYQILESKAFGADVILLIAACLSEAEVKKFSSFAKSLGLSVLLEIHGENELAHICGDIDVVGINNRDLKTFTVDLDHSVSLGKKIGSGKIKISESGIDEVATIHFLKKNGFNGFLIGEKFMKEKDPGLAFKKFAEDLKTL